VAIIGYLLLAVGFIIYLVGAIKFLIAAYNVSVVWLVCCLLVPFAGLVFLIKYWDVAKKPFFTMLLGMVPLILGSFLLPSVSV